MASNSKVFKISTFHALCLPETSDRAESFFFHIPCKPFYKLGSICSYVKLVNVWAELDD